MEFDDELKQARNLLEQGSILEASTILRGRLETDPSSAPACFLMSRIARLSGDLEMAERMVNVALSKEPNCCEWWIERGQILTRPARLAEAMGCYGRALELDPHNFSAHLALGDILAGQNQFRSALLHFQQAVEASPHSADAYNKLGDMCGRLALGDEAERAFLACLKIDPHHVQALIRLGNLYRDRHQPSRAKNFYEQALRIRPNDPYILCNLANAFTDLGDAAAAFDCYQRSLFIYRDQPTTHSNLIFTLYYVAGIPPRDIVTIHTEWDRVYAQKIEPLGAFQNHDFSDHRPLRVGFLSGDFRNHPVGRFAEVLFPHLNPQEVTVFAYHSGTREDDVTGRIRKHAAHFFSIHDLGDRDVANSMREDQIDILWDLSGHTSGNRLLLFAHRPTPIQISSWVYPGTTGLSSIDYRITDPYADLPNAEELGAPEKLARLPSISWIYQPPQASPDPVPAPCLQGRRFTFGCLNNPIKVSDGTVQLWSELLKRLPATRLLLLSWNDPEHVTYLRERFLKRGVEPQQLEFRPRGSTPAYLAYHAEIDLMLDPFPYNGCTTTCDALWMGVPVLTLAGNYYVSRQGVSFLTNLRMPECIATSPADFLGKAARWAASPDQTQQLRMGLREKLQSSPMMDYAAYARALSTLFGELWRKRCQHGP